MSRRRVVRGRDGVDTIYTRVCVYRGQTEGNEYDTPLEDFFRSEAGQWVLEHSNLEKPEILRSFDYQRFLKYVQVWTWLSGPDLTYWNLRWNTGT